MICGGRRARTGGIIAVTITERAYCGVTVGRDTFGCAGTPYRLVACIGYATVGSFSWPWDTNDAGDGIVIRSSPC